MRKEEKTALNGTPWNQESIHNIVSHILTLLGPNMARDVEGGGI